MNLFSLDARTFLRIAAHSHTHSHDGKGHPVMFAHSLIYDAFFTCSVCWHLFTGVDHIHTLRPAAVMLRIICQHQPAQMVLVSMTWLPPNWSLYDVCVLGAKPNVSNISRSLASMNGALGIGDKAIAGAFVDAIECSFWLWLQRSHGYLQLFSYWYARC